LEWRNLESNQDLDSALHESEKSLVMIFKHSTRCNISDIAKIRLEQDWDETLGIIPYYLDLIRFRDLSNHIATKFHVYHESPQVLLIKNGECYFDVSHLDITIKEISEAQFG
jgi:bacillithiol system protein YtxJ